MTLKNKYNEFTKNNPLNISGTEIFSPNSHEKKVINHILDNQITLIEDILYPGDVTNVLFQWSYFEFARGNNVIHFAKDPAVTRGFVETFVKSVDEKYIDRKIIAKTKLFLCSKENGFLYSKNSGTYAYPNPLNAQVPDIKFNTIIINKGVLNNHIRDKMIPITTLIPESRIIVVH